MIASRCKLSSRPASITSLQAVPAGWLMTAAACQLQSSPVVHELRPPHVHCHRQGYSGRRPFDTRRIKQQLAAATARHDEHVCRDPVCAVCRWASSVAG